MKYPIVEKINDSIQGLEELERKLDVKDLQKVKEILLEFPTVYIHSWKDTDDYDVYIGETNNIIQRTRQHFGSTGMKEKWNDSLSKNNANLYIIGHEHFNKSLTLDIENRLMLYLMSSEHVRKIHNLRGNPQRKYYPDFEMDSIFQRIWKKLRRDNKELFPQESVIKDSAVFKASPLHRLTGEQEQIKDKIIDRVFNALDTEMENQLIFIEGEAGTGKTVLNSSTFYDIYSYAEEKGDKSLQCCLIVNHDEQIRVYKQIALKLGLEDKYGEIIWKPTRFINHHTSEAPIDVAFIDEAHLLLTQGKQAYKGRNQLQDIMCRAKVTVVMFDENQILTTEQYWEFEKLEYFRALSKKQGNYFVLTKQLRIKASEEIIDWIDCLTKKQEIHPIPKEKGGYEIKIFDDPFQLEKAIKEKTKNDDHKLSRMIATYDWSYNPKPVAKKRLLKYWEVIIGKWHKPWNYELEKDLDKNTKRKNKSLAWAEQPQTIDEIGSTFTIQGFDLNYAGVILGPSVKYRKGKIVFDPAESCNRKAVQNRTLSDGSRQKFGEILLRHEVRILMTRGVEGIYIYACDPELQEALARADA
ncbi:DUF2075 domain-containing protein [Faecalicatena fissicatena]|uniref:DUF2075 domain-containing protein n=1 Tax=Faecalicatena fissicatena TaxID=290055 RepID=A0ABS2EAR4_9FIRM|nr:DUF2075 domain-containing protein [Faecalicatena fissicatena]MBM6738742.1 DUF2075 domain-containing protein [Faecalicatena fissicatena]